MKPGHHFTILYRSKDVILLLLILLHELDQNRTGWWRMIRIEHFTRPWSVSKRRSVQSHSIVLPQTSRVSTHLHSDTLSLNLNWDYALEISTHRFPCALYVTYAQYANHAASYKPIYKFSSDKLHEEASPSRGFSKSWFNVSIRNNASSNREKCESLLEIETPSAGICNFIKIYTLTWFFRILFKCRKGDRLGCDGTGCMLG